MISLFQGSPLRTRSIPTACLLLALTAVGCGGGNAAKDFVPAGNQARQALEVMLEAWHAGSTAKTELRIPGSGPAIQIHDIQQGTSKRLEKFEVVREVPGQANEPRQFEVKLKIEGQESEIDTTYFVVGIDPLHVFRDTDYKQLNMDK